MSFKSEIHRIRFFVLCFVFCILFRIIQHSFSNFHNQSKFSSNFLQLNHRQSWFHPYLIFLYWSYYIHCLMNWLSWWLNFYWIFIAFFFWKLNVVFVVLYPHVYDIVSVRKNFNTSLWSERIFNMLKIYVKWIKF